MAEAKDYEKSWQGMCEELVADLPDQDTPETDVYQRFKQEEEERNALIGGRAASPNIEPPPAVAQKSTPIRQYDMPSAQRGIALIISNKTFHMHGEVCEGTDNDAEALTTLWKELHFDTRVLRDQTAKEMRDDLERLADLKDNDEDYNCVVVCILSHGRKRLVFGSDGGSVGFDEVFEQFYNTNVKPSLRGKPKMFFIQACRDKNMMKSVKIVQDPASVETAQNVADATDILCLSAKTTGCGDFRTPTGTSLFIQRLVDVFTEDHTNVDVDSMMSKVAEKTNNGSGKRVVPLREGSVGKKIFLR